MFFKPLGPVIPAMHDGAFWPHFCNLADRTGDAALASTPEKALKLVQSYASVNCGGSTSACPPITLTYADAPDQQALAQALVAQWRRVLPG